MDIWNFLEQYTKPDSNFLKQLLIEKKFEDVKLSKTPSRTIQAILQTVPKGIVNDILQRKYEQSQKDWMKIKPKLESSITLSECVYYGLFIHDTKIISPFEKPTSLKLFDVSKPNGKCFHTEECPSVQYGLCHSRVNETLDEVYVSFKSVVVLYHIDVEDTAKFTKLQTIHLHVNESMLAISSGLSTVFSANNVKAFICSHDFNVEHDVKFKKYNV